jgi:diguanylate cyclase (GGDEF)-like protein
MIEDNPSDSVITSRRLLKDPPVPLALTSVNSLETAWPILDQEGVDVVLTDLNLADSDGLDTLLALRARAPRVPVVVLTGLGDEVVGVRAVQMGAQDFLQKGRFDSHTIQRALLYAVERHRLMQTLSDLSLIDPLTGLYNRRGLLAVSGKRLEMAQRLSCRAFVLFADLDDLKRVNDEQGHQAGDTYLRLAAETMKQSFRAADVVARVGGDEFVVLGLETSSFDPGILTDRVQRTLQRLAREHQVSHPVSISCGIERFDPTRIPLETAIQTADAAMYEVKRTRGRG